MGTYAEAAAPARDVSRRRRSVRLRISRDGLSTLVFLLPFLLVFGVFSSIPIILAVLISETRRHRGLYSALVYLPVVVPPVVSVLLWRFFFDEAPTGVFNTILGWFGLGPLPWLQDAGSAMPSIVMEATWAAAGGTVIIYLAAM